MSDIICVTNRFLCEDLVMQVKKIATVKPVAIILREKDLDEREYKKIAEKVMAICRQKNCQCILHSFPKVAKSLGCHAIHLPLPTLEQLNGEEKKYFNVLGASCHSVDDAKRAEYLGCTYITAGHIYETDCKKGLPGRGTEFLNEVVKSVNIPVYAIGGITPVRYNKIMKTGAQGICLMSSLMKSKNPEKLLKDFEKVKEKGE